MGELADINDQQQFVRNNQVKWGVHPIFEKVRGERVPVGYGGRRHRNHDRPLTKLNGEIEQVRGEASQTLKQVDGIGAFLCLQSSRPRQSEAKLEPLGARRASATGSWYGCASPGFGSELGMISLSLDQIRA